MFELSIALKYLVPRKKHFSVTLIALVSTVVISLVVWLLLVFLSVTEGMEKNWLNKLTSLNAPLKITPTPAYFSSYYYKIDSISSASGFSYKTLGEKQKALFSNPYNPEEDGEIPLYWPKADISMQGTFVDPVKELSSLLIKIQKQEQKDLLFQDYEMSGALLKLQLLRNLSPAPFSSGQESLHFLTQVSYLATPPSNPRTIKPLLIPPSKQDISHLFFLAGYRMDNILSDQSPDIMLATEEFKRKLSALVHLVHIHTLKTVLPQFSLPSYMLPKEKPFVVHCLFEGDSLIEIALPERKTSPLSPPLCKGQLVRSDRELLIHLETKTISLSLDYPLTLLSPLIFQANLERDALDKVSKIQDLSFWLTGSIQGQLVNGCMSWKNLEIDSFSLESTENQMHSPPPWIYEKTTEEMVLPLGDKQDFGILLPKSFQENNVLLGDRGFLSYSASTTSSVIEQRIPVFVAGFYDPGILSVGNKCLLVPRPVTRTINAANSSFTFDKIALNGFQLWVNDPSKVDILKKQLEDALQKEGLHSYWKVTSFKEYDFAKDLLEQFQSDKYLFSLVGILILIVACCNILSFLILLVNDKKKEIAILQAMGAPKKSIALIFGVCGVVIGSLGCVIGIGAAIATLKNMDLIVRALSHLQGHDAFNVSFYGSSLSSTLSSGSLAFFAIATPMLSLLAGLIPALKACRLHPSSILRSES